MLPHSNKKGILIYAFNSNFDYIKMAKFAAKQAKKFLKLPVTLVTDVEITTEIFDSVIVIPSGENSKRHYRTNDNTLMLIDWKNQNRTTAYDISPYEQTLLIDADYFMYNDSLALLFDTNSKFACYDQINDLTGKENDLIRVSSSSIPMQWATVVYFTKCPFAESIFTFMEKIKQDWEYYSLLYKFNSGAYRNDFALSIALQTLSGYATNNFDSFPGKLHTIFSDTSIESVTKDGEIVFKWGNQVNKVINTNVHCMNKLNIDKFYNATT